MSNIFSPQTPCVCVTTESNVRVASGDHRFSNQLNTRTIGFVETIFVARLPEYRQVRRYYMADDSAATERITTTILGRCPAYRYAVGGTRREFYGLENAHGRHIHTPYGLLVRAALVDTHIPTRKRQTGAYLRSGTPP